MERLWNHIQSIYLRHHVFRFEKFFHQQKCIRSPKSKWVDTAYSKGSGFTVTKHIANPKRNPNSSRVQWQDKEFEMREIDDLNGFLCCICCMIPFVTIKAVFMMFIHLAFVTPTTFIISLLLFPFQLIMIYVASASTNLLGFKAKIFIFIIGWLLYTLFFVFYLIAINISCILFSFYAAFKTTLSTEYNICGGFNDALRVVMGNMDIYWTNNTKEFYVYCHSIKHYRLDEALGEEQWEISLLSWCSKLTAFCQIILSIIMIMTFVLIEIAIYFIPFSLHILCHLYFVQFFKYYIVHFVPNKPCLALIALPFIIVFLVFIPLLVALYLVLFLWCYSALFNKAILIEKYTDSPFHCLQHWNYIVNTVILYHRTLFTFCFQSCRGSNWNGYHGDDEYQAFDFDPESLRNIAERKAAKQKKRIMASRGIRNHYGISCNVPVNGGSYNAMFRDSEDEILQLFGRKQKRRNKRNEERGHGTVTVDEVSVESVDPHKVTLQHITWSIFGSTENNDKLVIRKNTEKENRGKVTTFRDQTETVDTVKEEEAGRKVVTLKIKKEINKKIKVQDEARNKQNRTPSQSSLEEMRERLTMLNGGFPGMSVEHIHESIEIVTEEMSINELQSTKCTINELMMAQNSKKWRSRSKVKVSRSGSSGHIPLPIDSPSDSLINTISSQRSYINERDSDLDSVGSAEFLLTVPSVEDRELSCD